jgi:hypothetical protein
VTGGGGLVLGVGASLLHGKAGAAMVGAGASILASNVIAYLQAPKAPPETKGKAPVPVESVTVPRLTQAQLSALEAQLGSVYTDLGSVYADLTR